MRSDRPSVEDWARLWQRFDKQFPLEEYPITNRIWLEVFRRSSSLDALPGAMAGARRLALSELEGLVYLVIPKPPAQERRALMEQVVSHLPYDRAKAALSIMKRGLRGRPQKRAKALQALEFRILNPSGKTWADLARQFYGCNHKRCKCGQLLRREVIHVKRFLTRMGLTLPDTP